MADEVTPSSERAEASEPPESAGSTAPTETPGQAETSTPDEPPEMSTPDEPPGTPGSVEAPGLAGAVPAPAPASAPAPALAPVRDRRAPRRRTLVAVGWAAVATVAAVVVAGVVTAVGIVTGDHGGGRSLRAKPGDCLSGESDHDLRFAPCDDPAVKWAVVSVVQRQSKQDSEQKSCQPWPEAQASYWESRNGRDGFVLCLRPVSAD